MILDFKQVHDFFSEDALSLDPDINYNEYIYWFLYNAQMVIQYTQIHLSYNDFLNDLNDAAGRAIRNWLHLKIFFAFCLLKHNVHDIEKDAMFKKMQNLAEQVNDLMEKVKERLATASQGED